MRRHDRGRAGGRRSRRAPAAHEALVPAPDPHPEVAPPVVPARVRRRADAALVVAAFCFGTTFAVVQDAVEAADPVPFLAVRFLLGAVVLAVAARGRPARPHERRDGVAAGMFLLAGFVLQTVGLQYTSSSTSAFLTYLLVVFVPVISFASLRRRPHPLTLVGMVLAVVGLVLLTGGADERIGRGEVLTLGCAVAFAAHIVVLGEVAPRHDAVRLTFVQVGVVGVACLAVSVVAGGLPLPGAAVGAAAFTGVFATAVAFLAMVWAQRVVTPARAALVLLLEPVFAALLARVRGDHLSSGALGGGALILGAVVVAEVVPSWWAARVGGREGRGPSRPTGHTEHDPGPTRPARPTRGTRTMARVAETIEQSGRRIGGHAWVEMRLFETLGRWSATVGAPRARLTLAAASGHRAVHAEAWTGLLPRVPHLPPPDLVAPDVGAAAVVAELEALEEAPTGARLTAVVDRALPHLIDRYQAHLDVTTPVSDAPTERALLLAIAEARADRDALATVAAVLPDTGRGQAG